MKYFAGVDTLEELNLKRSEILSEVNRQYREERDKMKNANNGVKPLRFVHLDAIETPETPLFAAFKIERGQVPGNEIHMKGDTVHV